MIPAFAIKCYELDDIDTHIRTYNDVDGLNVLQTKCDADKCRINEDCNSCLLGTINGTKTNGQRVRTYRAVCDRIGTFVVKNGCEDIPKEYVRQEAVRLGDTNAKLSGQLCSCETDLCNTASKLCIFSFFGLLALVMLFV